MKKVSLIIVFIALLFSGCGQEFGTPDPTISNTEHNSAELPPGPDLIDPTISNTEHNSAELPLETEPEMISTTKEFDMIAKQWTFDPETIIVNHGDEVVLHITSIDVTHGFRLSEFGINEELKQGESVDVTFVADQKGEFTYECSLYCGSGHSHMKGKLIVE